jgi:hypothetical protein
MTWAAEAELNLASRCSASEWECSMTSGEYGLPTTSRMNILAKASKR